MARVGKALEVTAPRQFRIIEVEAPTPLADEVLIEIRACATCTNWELQTWRGTDIFDRPGHPIYPQNPGSPGHEAAGVVLEAGAEVLDLAPGDPVAIYGSLRGPENDAHATHVTRPASLVAKLDPRIPFVEAAPLEMGLCAVRSVEMALPLAGRAVGVVGLGPAGILHLQVARAYGAAHVVGIDVVASRLAAAGPFADAVVDARDEAALRRLIDQGAEVVFECSGSGAGMATGLDLTRETLRMFAVPDGSLTWGKAQWMHGISVVPYDWRGGSSQVECLRRAAQLLADGQLDTKAIVSAVLPYTEYAEGLRMLESREAIKVVFSGWE